MFNLIKVLEATNSTKFKDCISLSSTNIDGKSSLSLGLGGNIVISSTHTQNDGKTQFTMKNNDEVLCNGESNEDPTELLISLVNKI